MVLVCLEHARWRLGAPDPDQVRLRPFEVELLCEIPSVAGNINASTKDVCFTFVPNQINSHSIAGSITYWIVEAIDLSFR
jgi:hypothetical protein